MKKEHAVWETKRKIADSGGKSVRKKMMYKQYNNYN
jgi:hypothetical protein